MEYDKLTTKVAPKKKAVKKVPKVQKSGRGNSKKMQLLKPLRKSVQGYRSQANNKMPLLSFMICFKEIG